MEIHENTWKIFRNPAEKELFSRISSGNIIEIRDL
jgi:hypothetical protein